VLGRRGALDDGRALSKTPSASRLRAFVGLKLSEGVSSRTSRTVVVMVVAMAFVMAVMAFVMAVMVDVVIMIMMAIAVMVVIGGCDRRQGGKADNQRCGSQKALEHKHGSRCLSDPESGQAGDDETASMNERAFSAPALRGLSCQVISP
jgi:hypothetical protein